MDYLQRYDKVVMKKCALTKSMENIKLVNIGNGKVMRDVDGGFVAQKPTKEQMIKAFASKFEHTKDLTKLKKDFGDLELDELEEKFRELRTTLSDGSEEEEVSELEEEEVSEDESGVDIQVDEEITESMIDQIVERLDETQRPLSQSSIDTLGRMQRLEYQPKRLMSGMKNQMKGRAITMELPSDIEEQIKQRPFRRPREEEMYQ